MVWPLPALSGAALVPRGRRGQSDEPAVSALPQGRAGDARDVLDAGLFAPQHGTEEAARRVEVVSRQLAPSRAVARRLATAFRLGVSQRVSPAQIGSPSPPSVCLQRSAKMLSSTRLTAWRSSSEGKGLVS